MDAFEAAFAEPMEARAEPKPDHVANVLREAETAIDSYLAELALRIEKAKSYAPETAIACEFIRAFPALAGDSNWEWDRPLHVHLALDPNTVNAFMLNLDALKLTDVSQPLRWLAQRFGAYTIDDYPELGRRAYVFENNGRPVRFQVFFNNNEAVCKFVKVGVKEEPVYKLMCGETEVIAEAETSNHA